MVLCYLYVENERSESLKMAVFSKFLSDKVETIFWESKAESV